MYVSSIQVRCFFLCGGLVSFLVFFGWGFVTPRSRWPVSLHCCALLGFDFAADFSNGGTAVFVFLGEWFLYRRLVRITE